MTKQIINKLLLVTLGLTLAATVVAADLAREARLANQIVDAIMDGEAIELDADGHSFLAIEMESATDTPRGAAIILHGRGLHPNWDQVVKPLRTLLPQQGWHTLALQMPVLAKEAKYYDYVPTFTEAGPRIEAAIAHLRGQGFEHIALIAHSCGAHMAMNWVDLNGDKDIAAYIGIGMGATDYQQKMARPFPLDKMKVPVLDIYGEKDLPAVVRMAPERWKTIRQAGNKHSKQVLVEGSDHYFVGKDEELAEAVASWLNTTFE